MKVKVKKLCEEAIIPSYAHITDAGLDLTATSRTYDEKKKCWVYGTGLAFEIPTGHVGLLFPRSSVRKYDLIMCNSVGVIDSSYRGEVMLSFRQAMNGTGTIYNIGERIGQLIILPYPHIDLVESEILAESDRGEGGHGSTGE